MATPDYSCVCWCEKRMVKIIIEAKRMRPTVAIINVVLGCGHTLADTWQKARERPRPPASLRITTLVSFPDLSMRVATPECWRTFQCHFNYLTQRFKQPASDETLTRLRKSGSVASSCTCSAGLRRCFCGAPNRL